MKLEVSVSGPLFAVRVITLSTGPVSTRNLELSTCYLGVLLCAAPADLCNTCICQYVSLQTEAVDGTSQFDAQALRRTNRQCWVVHARGASGRVQYDPIAGRFSCRRGRLPTPTPAGNHCASKPASVLDPIFQFATQHELTAERLRLAVVLMAAASATRCCTAREYQRPSRTPALLEGPGTRTQFALPVIFFFRPPANQFENRRP